MFEKTHNLKQFQVFLVVILYYLCHNNVSVYVRLLLLCNKFTANAQRPVKTTVRETHVGVSKLLIELREALDFSLKLSICISYFVVNLLLTPLISLFG